MARKKGELDRLIESCLSTEAGKNIHLSYPDIEAESEILNFYKLQRKAYKYAIGFFHFLSIGSNVYPSLLPIVFNDNLASIAEAVENGSAYNPDCFRSGNGYSSNEKQAVIFISLPRTTTVLSAPLKREIRHELIHYYLWLMDLPNDDDCALFWAYSKIFSGGAYEKMSVEEKEKYDRFIEISKEYPDASYSPLKHLAEAIITEDENAMNAFKIRYNFEKQFK